jgi:hypothetical protein
MIETYLHLFPRQNLALVVGRDFFRNVELEIVFLETSLELILPVILSVGWSLVFLAHGTNRLCRDVPEGLHETFCDELAFFVKLTAQHQTGAVLSKEELVELECLLFVLIE